MVIEDDPGVTAVITEGLHQLGYRVINVTNGEQALDCLDERKQIDLVLSDIVLPGGLSGLDVEEAMRKVRPDVRFIFMSGYAQDEIARKGPRLGRGLPGIDILRKPFQLTDLADRVIEALAADA
jgi:CheY-like chemotaxis protein